MTHAEREKIVYRVIAGFFKCSIKDDAGKSLTLLLKSPNAYQRYRAEEIYTECLQQYELEGLKTEDGLADFLLDKGIWDSDKEGKLNGLIKDIENLKVGLCEMTFRSNEREVVRKSLANAKIALDKLYSLKNSYNHLSASGAALTTKARYLVAVSLYYLDGYPFMHSEQEFWHSTDTVVEAIVEETARERLTETIVRELVRSEPWRSIWNAARKATGGKVFNVASVDLTDEQRSLCIWSGIYDSIYEHPKSPADNIIEDDDALDGWMIIQKRERDKEKNNIDAEGVLGNEKIRNAEEVFIPANTQEDANKIIDLNSPHSKALQRKRLALVQQRGSVSEADMPDSKLKIQSQLTQMYKEGMKNG